MSKTVLYLESTQKAALDAGFAAAFIFIYFEFATVAWLAGYDSLAQFVNMAL